jgi:ATP-binding protein involved in chromosome partitioning
MTTVHADPARVRAAVAAVLDPEIGRPLGELGMIGETTVGRGGRVHMQLRLTTESCPLASELRTAVVMAARAVEGVREVDVDVATMTAHERAELAEQLKRDATPLTSALGISGTQVYAVASGKGGVGKSTVTANLAAALAATGKRVGVLDADVWGYSIPYLFGVRRTPVVLGEMMLPVPAHGVSLMSIGFFVTENQPVVWRGPMLHKALQQFITDTYWGDLDALFVDLPPCHCCSCCPARRCLPSPPRRPPPASWLPGWRGWPPRPASPSPA